MQLHDLLTVSLNRAGTIDHVVDDTGGPVTPTPHGPEHRGELPVSGPSLSSVSPAPPRPFAPGSVSIRLYPHNELPADAIVRELCAQAGLALGNGFDGVMTSEHHGGFAGYMAQPLQMASFVLAAHPTGWAAAAPLFLPLRPTALVAEEVAWLQARYGGRVGLGVAAGALPLDFEAAGVGQADAVERFKAELPRLVAMLRGEDLGGLEGDPALLACRARPGARAQRRRLGCRRRPGGPLRRGHPHGGDVGAFAARPPHPGLRGGRRHGCQGPDPPGVARAVCPPGSSTDQRAVYESYAGGSERVR